MFISDMYDILYNNSYTICTYKDMDNIKFLLYKSIPINMQWKFRNYKSYVMKNGYRNKFSYLCGTESEAWIRTQMDRNCLTTVFATKRSTYPLRTVATILTDAVFVALWWKMSLTKAKRRKGITCRTWTFSGIVAGHQIFGDGQNEVFGGILGKHGDSCAMMCRNWWLRHLRENTILACLDFLLQL